MPSPTPARETCTDEDIYVGAEICAIGEEAFRGFDPDRHDPWQKGLPMVVTKCDDTNGLVSLIYKDDRTPYYKKVTKDEIKTSGRYYPERRRHDRRQSADRRQ